jgi:hypothetical protein
VDVRRCGRRVPEQLGVVVGVGVDEPGGDHEALGVEHLGGVVAHLAHRHDPPVPHPDVGPAAGRTRPVDHRRPTNHEIEHAHPRWL